MQPDRLPGGAPLEEDRTVDVGCLEVLPEVVGVLAIATRLPRLGHEHQRIVAEWPLLRLPDLPSRAQRLRHTKRERPDPRVVRLVLVERDGAVLEVEVVLGKRRGLADAGIVLGAARHLDVVGVLAGQLARGPAAAQLAECGSPPGTRPEAVCHGWRRGLRLQGCDLHGRRHSLQVLGHGLAGADHVDGPAHIIESLALARRGPFQRLEGHVGGDVFRSPKPGCEVSEHHHPGGGLTRSPPFVRRSLAR